MKLSKEQIEQLKNLISYKGHVYIDVQYEILDHVACKVEGLMEENPNLPLDEAFRKVFASFGAKGFNELEASYQKMIEKRHRSYFWEELKCFLFSYKVLLVMGIFALFYQFRHEFESNNGWIEGLLMLFIFCAVTMAVFHWRKFKKYRKYASFNTTGNFFLIVSFVYQLCSFSYITLNSSLKDKTIWTSYGVLGVTVLLASMFACLFILPKVFQRSQADTEKLIQQYQTN
ncbi:hypothetical protein [Mongoliitalea lutea]|uniref:Uncharacterized protein n=1 Tax=Mongoliitalea lutea TaxID=849756 RepID=A0A8J3CWR2_9BACT|nr:hypothetical protein [Mongoliitalea lutea]GHB34514.1 hypothetical protein GCM10008106_14900 [Mongoliitalea lutea]